VVRCQPNPVGTDSSPLSNSARNFASTMALPLKAHWSRRASSPPESSGERLHHGRRDASELAGDLLGGSVAVAQHDPVGVSCLREGLLHEVGHHPRENPRPSVSTSRLVSVGHTPS
jgi:hypothetical protein